MKHLVFIGNYGNGNVGDDAILHVLSSRYAKVYPDIKQHVVSKGYDDQIRKISQADPLHINVASLFWIIAHVEMIVIGGGGLFSRKMGPVAQFITLFAIFCRIIGKKIIFESVGVYANLYWYQKIPLYLAMLMSEQVSVREKTSYQHLAFVRRFKKVLLVEDPAFDVIPVHKDAAKKLLVSEGIPEKVLSKKMVAITPRKAGRAEINKRELANLVAVIEWFQRKNIPVVFIPFCHDKEKDHEKDVKYAEEISAHAKNTDGIYFITSYYTPSEQMGIVSLMALLIGGRFHSQVFAHKMKIPLIPLMIGEKGYEMMSKEFGYAIVDFNKEVPDTATLEVIKKINAV